MDFLQREPGADVLLHFSEIFIKKKSFSSYLFWGELGRTILLHFSFRISLGETSSEFLQREPGRAILLSYSLRWLIRGYSLGPPKGYSLWLPKGYSLWPPKGSLWEGSGRLESDSCYAKLLLFRPWKGTAFWATISRGPGKAILLHLSFQNKLGRGLFRIPLGFSLLE